jgi:hypothetical protein
MISQSHGNELRLVLSPPQSRAPRRQPTAIAPVWHQTHALEIVKPTSRRMTRIDRDGVTPQQIAV